ncbi:type II secretion system GspH family protein [bacterium]|nr:type II secretion system GspH family protein [bacterium]
MRKIRRAFTLIELLVVVAIISILASIAVYNLLEAQTRAKVTRTQSDMRAVTVAIESYYLDCSVYPRMNPNQQCDRGYLILSIHDNFLSYRGGYEPDMGPGGGVPISLTTPIAYMTSIPIDPFIGKMPLSHTGTYRWTFDRENCSFFFYDFRGCMRQRGLGWRDDLPDVVAPAPMRFNGPGGQVVYAEWALLSAGPDQSFVVRENPHDEKDPYVSYQFFMDKQDWQGMLDGVFSTYDPTNGTVSEGDIWRTSAGQL